MEFRKSGAREGDRGSRQMDRQVEGVKCLSGEEVSCVERQKRKGERTSSLPIRHTQPSPIPLRLDRSSSLCTNPQSYTPPFLL